MRPLRVEVSESTTGSAVFVNLMGEFDLADEQLFSKAVTNGVVQNGHTTVALDCSELTFLDSSGLHAMLRAQREAETRGASFVLVAPSAAVRKIVHVAGLTDHFTVVPDEHDLGND